MKYKEPKYKGPIYIVQYDCEDHTSWFFVDKEEYIKTNNKKLMYNTVQEIPYGIGYIEKTLPKDLQQEWNQMEWYNFAEDWKVYEILKIFGLNPKKIEVIYDYSMDDEAQWTIYPEPDCTLNLDDLEEPKFGFLIVGKRTGIESLYNLIKKNLKTIQNHFKEGA